MLDVIRDLLQEKINDIDSGNSNITEDKLLEIINFFRRLNSKELNKTLAANYIGVCRATFENYIKRGWIPKGTKEQGENKLYWNVCDLDKFLETWKKT